MIIRNALFYIMKGCENQILFYFPCVPTFNSIIDTFFQQVDRLCKFFIFIVQLFIYKLFIPNAISYTLYPLFTFLQNFTNVIYNIYTLHLHPTPISVSIFTSFLLFPLLILLTASVSSIHFVFSLNSLVLNVSTPSLLYLLPVSKTYQISTHYRIGSQQQFLCILVRYSSDIFRDKHQS